MLRLPPVEPVASGTQARLSGAPGAPVLVASRVGLPTPDAGAVQATSPPAAPTLTRRDASPLSRTSRGIAQPPGRPSGSRRRRCRRQCPAPVLHTSGSTMHLGELFPDRATPDLIVAQLMDGIPTFNFNPAAPTPPAAAATARAVSGEGRGGPCSMTVDRVERRHGDSSWLLLKKGGFSLSFFPPRTATHRPQHHHQMILCHPR